MSVSSIIQILHLYNAFHKKLWLRCLYTTFVDCFCTINKVEDNKETKGAES